MQEGLQFVKMKTEEREKSTKKKFVPVGTTLPQPHCAAACKDNIMTYLLA